MTTLGLSEGAAPDRILAKVNWPVVVPWLVAVLLAGTSGYHRFLTQEANRAQDAAAIEKLTGKVDDLTRQVAVLTAVVERLEQRQQRQDNSDPDPVRRSRIFDK